MLQGFWKNLLIPPLAHPGIQGSTALGDGKQDATRPPLRAIPRSPGPSPPRLRRQLPVPMTNGAIIFSMPWITKGIPRRLPHLPIPPRVREQNIEGSLIYLRAFPFNLSACVPRRWLVSFPQGNHEIDSPISTLWRLCGSCIGHRPGGVHVSCEPNMAFDFQRQRDHGHGLSPKKCDVRFGNLAWHIFD